MEKKEERGGEVFYTKKVCSKFEKNRSSSFCRIVFTDFEKLVFRKTRLKFSTLLAISAQLWSFWRKRRRHSGAHYFESFAPIDLKFWHNIFEMLSFKKMWKKSIFRICLSLTRPSPPLSSQKNKTKNCKYTCFVCSSNVYKQSTGYTHVWNKIISFPLL